MSQRPPDWMDYTRCYLCSNPLGTERNSDHVVPAGIFPRGRKTKGLIELPAHPGCNSGLGLDDEAFRTHLSMFAAENDANAEAVFKNRALKRLTRPESAKFRLDILERIVPVEVQSEAGLYLGDAEALLVGARRHARVLHRITRGLHAKLTKDVLPADWPVGASWIDPATAAPLFQVLGLRFAPVGDGSFRYARAILRDAPRETVIWMSFYRTVHFWGFTGRIWPSAMAAKAPDGVIWESHTAPACDPLPAREDQENET